MPRCTQRPPLCALGPCLRSSNSTAVWQSSVSWQCLLKWLPLLHILLLSRRIEAVRSEASNISDAFDVIDASMLHHDEAKNGEPNIGEACRGKKYTKSGNCGSVYVQSPSAKDWLVQTYCYSQDSTTVPGTKAGSGKPGVCQIPRTKPCYADEHCRRGTYCLPSDTEGCYTCQEASLKTHYHADTENKAVAVVRMMFFVVVPYIEALAAATVPSLIHDPRTGAVSPYGANIELAQAALGALFRSFSDASDAKVEVPAASKSKAIFVYSGDGRFLIKSVRKEEFTNFAGGYAEKIARATGLADVVCENAEKEWCWAAATLKRTALSVPVLGFSSPSTTEYWLVMPAASLFRGLVISQGEENLSPWGEAAYYDVKPWPAKSNARAKFVWNFARMHISPFAEEEDRAENVNQWVSVMKSMQLAVEVLGGHSGDDSSSSVDYSLLFEVYRPNKTLANPGQNCIASRECFPNGQPFSCRLICVSIIDFLTTFNFARKFESFWKHGKFNAYNGKVIELVNCLAAPRDGFRPGLGSKRLPMQHHGQPGFSVTMPVDGEWETNSYQVCLPYLEMACSEVLTETCCCDLMDNYVKFTLSWKADANIFCFNYLAMMNWVYAKRKKTKGEIDKLEDARITHGATTSMAKHASTYASEAYAWPRQGRLARPV